jgi:hypothetical protein
MNRSTLHSPWCFNYPTEVIHRLISLIHIFSISTYFFLLPLNYTIPCPLRCSVLVPPILSPSVGRVTDSYPFMSLQLYHVFRAVKKLNLTKFNFSGCRIGFFLFFRRKEYPICLMRSWAAEACCLWDLRSSRSNNENYCALCYDTV